MDLEEVYKHSLQRIREIKGDITIKKWNKIAKEENLLCTESLKYISKMSFKNLIEEVRKEASK